MLRKHSRNTFVKTSIVGSAGMDTAEGLPHTHGRQGQLHHRPAIPGAVQPRQPGLDAADQVRPPQRHRHLRMPGTCDTI